MLMSSSDLMNHLPDRRCTECGCLLEVQADCHQTVCGKCRGDSFYPIYPYGETEESVRIKFNGK